MKVHHYILLIAGLSCFKNDFKSVNASPLSRQLELECPIAIKDIQFSDDDDKPDYDVTTMKLASYSQGSLGIELIRKLRGKSTEFYQSLLNNLIAISCDVDTQGAERCVDFNSSLATKDWEDNCIIAADQMCPTGTCERASSCYWDQVVNGEIRETRFPVEMYDLAEDDVVGLHKDSYLGGIAMFGTVGIIIACVCFCMWFVYIVARCLCCCMWDTCSICECCSSRPREDGYSCFGDLAVPIIIYIICLVGTVSAGSLALVGNEDITRAATSTFFYSSALIEDFGEFLSRAREPLMKINAIVEDAAGDAQIIFSDTEYVREGSTEIVSSFRDFGIRHEEGIEASNSGPVFETAFMKFGDEVYPIVDDVQLMLDSLEMDLYNNVDNIRNGVTSATNQIDLILNETETWLEDVYRFESMEFSKRSIRKTIVLSVFFLSFIFSLAGLMGIVMSRTTAIFYLLHIAWVVCAVLGVVLLVVASFTLSTSVVWLDTCEVMNLVTGDFEPILGDAMATGANAIFDGTNLAVAFNVTDKVDFQSKLDEGLSQIKGINITQKFELVSKPLVNVQGMIDGITTKALEGFNKVTSYDSASCPFQDTYTKSNILQPWNAHLEKVIKDKITDYPLRSTGIPATYKRLSKDENAVQYLRRIYDAAGRCDGTSSCCLGDDCDTPSYNDYCTSGDDCVFICSNLRDGIVDVYKGYLTADTIERGMAADLGIDQTTCPARVNCPATLEFMDMGHDYPLMELLDLYKTNITETSNDLISVASTSVGMAMVEVKDFLCHMNVSFIEQRYDQVSESFCETMFGGFAQVNWALWCLAILMEIIAVVGCTLSIRLAGSLYKEVGIGGGY